MEKLKIIMIILALLSFNIAQAIPLPRGLDGIIYYSDGITEMPVNTSFMLCNININYCINGTTGYYAHSGKYSVAIKGNDGDTVVLKAWSKNVTSNRTLILNGSMHNVNLLLNLQQVPPESTPSSHTATKTRIGTESVSQGNALAKPESKSNTLKDYSINPLPQPKEEYIDVNGNIIGGSNVEFTIKNINNNEKIKSFTIAPNRFYVPVHAKKGDQLLMNINGEEHYFTVGNNSINITLKKPYNNHKMPKGIFVFPLILLTIFIIIWKKR